MPLCSYILDVVAINHPTQEQLLVGSRKPTLASQHELRRPWIGPAGVMVEPNEVVAHELGATVALQQLGHDEIISVFDDGVSKG
jgi:hypothetical protein